MTTVYVSEVRERLKDLGRRVPKWGTTFEVDKKRAEAAQLKKRWAPRLFERP